MKILHVCAGWEETNGAAVIARLIADEQKRKGADVRLASRADEREIREADEVWTHCGWLPVLWQAGRKARRLIRMPEACYDPVRLAYHGWKKRLVGPIERHFLRRAERVVATCEAEKEWILKYEPKARVEVTDIKRFFKLEGKEPGSGTKDGLRLLYLGRRHPLKGVEHLEKAVERTNAEAGRRAVELRIVSNATGEEKEKVWAWCDCLALPTLSENFGLVIAEALERGKRVITTDGAPAWEGDVRDEGDGLCVGHGGRLAYLKGYRTGTDENRAQLLKAAIERMKGERKC